NLMHNRQKLDLEIKPVNLNKGAIAKETKIAHLTGTTKFKLEDPARQELKRFIDAGGTLVIDAAGGSSAFAQAAEAEIAAIFPGESLKAIPPEHAIFLLGGKMPPIK